MYNVPKTNTSDHHQPMKKRANTHRALLAALGCERLSGHVVCLLEEHLLGGGRRRFVQRVLAQAPLHALGALRGDDFGRGGGRGAAAGIVRALGGGRHGPALTDRAGRRGDGEQHQTRLWSHHDRLGAVGGGLRAHGTGSDGARGCGGVVIVRVQVTVYGHTLNPLAG